MKFRDWFEKSVLSEKTTRAGIMSWAYPDGYVRSHYPNNYFTPAAADAIQKMGKKLDDDSVDHGEMKWKHHDKTKE
jgi:hypothetical protein